jgi:hypothetical protein
VRLIVALDFADNPRPSPSMAAPADTMEELREALRILAAEIRRLDPTAPKPRSQSDASAKQ